MERIGTVKIQPVSASASPEAETGLFFSNSLLYHSNYMQAIRANSTINTDSQGTSKAISIVQ